MVLLLIDCSIPWGVLEKSPLGDAIGNKISFLALGRALPRLINVPRKKTLLKANHPSTK